MNTGSAELDLLLLEIGDLCPQLRPRLACSCFISVRCAKYVRTGPAMVNVSTQTTAARMAARRAAEPSRCSDGCSADATIDCLDRHR